MKPVLTADEYRRIDKSFEGDLELAMDRAGYAIALAAVRHGASYGSRVVVLAGPGNNGGDGYVAARYLKRRGVSVEVRALTPPKTPLAVIAARRALWSGVPIAEMSTVGAADLVVDAVFGGGVRGGLPRSVKKWIDTEAPVVAVDFPTGLDPNTGNVAEVAFNAVETVTFGTIKTGHIRGAGPEHCGTVSVVDIGIDGGEPCMWLAEEEDAERPARERDAHKWNTGSVLVVGGSEGMIGAATFAARSALSFGAGAVAIASSQASVINAVAPEIMCFGLGEAAIPVEKFDVVVAGPGLDDDDVKPAKDLVRKAPQIVLDAGALRKDMVEAAKTNSGRVVATPHSAEFQRISGVGPGTYAVRAFAAKQELTVLLKGNPTRISSGSVPVIVDTGGPELSSIGTGDVLAGMVAALWARGLSPHDAAISGAFWHGVAGRELAMSQSVTADVLARYVGRWAF